MAWPLQDSDPRQLGVYRLVERSQVDSAGVVYLGHGPDGGDVSIALLSSNAAADPLARETFVAGAQRGAGVGSSPEVIASRLSGPPVMWVACDGSEAADAAAVFLGSVAPGTGRSAATRGPVYRPYWDRGPAAGVLSGAWRGWSGPWWGHAVSNRIDRRGVVLLLLLLALVVAVILLLAAIYPLLVDVREEAASSAEEADPNAEPSQEPSPEPTPESPEPSVEPEGESSPVPEVEVDPEELEEYQGEEGTSDPSDLG